LRVLFLCKTTYSRDGVISIQDLVVLSEMYAVAAFVFLQN
jgi:hypothetical protein